MFNTKEELQALYDKIYLFDYGDMGNPRENYPAWVPAYDNFDGTEQFWCLFEKTKATEEMKLALEWKPDQLCKDFMVSSYYIWIVSLYYSLLVIGGNELQPAQLLDMFYIVALNIVGLFFLTYLTGQISVLIANVIQKVGSYQEEIDIINSAMIHENLSQELQDQIRTYFVKV